ncbi:hypothetical protein RRG08_063609 [Elysia crispata]|uniref:Uncharacterized protein n=1 Tax=Elysia crispata TaxID=231223 RepID=A0AAE1AHK5_9GAST|nr:hypothetical protein RRG08_063609 [Elysia crispata]
MMALTGRVVELTCTMRRFSRKSKLKRRQTQKTMSKIAFSLDKFNKLKERHKDDLAGGSSLKLITDLSCTTRCLAEPVSGGRSVAGKLIVSGRLRLNSRQTLEKYKTRDKAVEKPADSYFYLHHHSTALEVRASIGLGDMWCEPRPSGCGGERAGEMF